MTRRQVPTGTRLLQIPRRLQIWDIDALHDEFVRTQLLTARLFISPDYDDTNNNNSNNKKERKVGVPLSSAAFLAAYLARTLLQLQHDEREQQRPTSAKGSPTLQAQYLSILPTYADYAKYHPVLLWNSTTTTSEVESVLGSYTHTYDVLHATRSLYRAEYAAFAHVSSEFAQTIDWSQYVAARLSVATRAFGTGPVEWPKQAVYTHSLRSPSSSSSSSSGTVVSSSFETVSLEVVQAAGLDLSHGCFAMIPILDSLDHHAKPHVGFALTNPSIVASSPDYQASFSSSSSSSSFVISAVRSIAAGSEIFDTYGKRSDSDLFARYGFVNGDGSDYTQASIALWHGVQSDEYQHDKDDDDNTRRPPLHTRILRYLQYDDGYEKCVEKSQTEAWELKKLKYRYLSLRSNLPAHWVATFGPRDPSSRPALSSKTLIQATPPSFDARLNGITFNGTALFSTCRLISLTHYDYNGQATALLTQHVDDLSYFLPEAPGHGLEFRTILCIARFASTALERFGRSLPDQYDLVARLNKNRNAVQSKEWMIEHIRLGEMQTLEALKKVAFSNLRAYGDRMNSEPAFTMRDNPCDRKHLQPLLAEILKEDETTVV